MKPLLTIVLPFFNEEGWIGRTIDSLAAQNDDRFLLLLIDNGSTDNSRAEAVAHISRIGEKARILTCATPGKIHALSAGLAEVDTPLIATCDADTIYPPDYIRRIIKLFGDDESAAAVMAIDLYAPVEDVRSRGRVAFIMRKARRFATKCHAGGYAQAFRTAALRAGGGFDAGRWPYVLEDHEIVHRVSPYGKLVYHSDHICFPSDRRLSRDKVSWSRIERLLYRYLPDGALNWYFYRFLGRRLAARNSMGIALREKDWTSPSA